ncbi:YHYH protein [uncultured Hoeflea sp.]|mgnify:CR=1 FL=1|uniref:YHYH protein n=1 Tax=uncultured Hoeflea sp. TaxID=538666 RepID=UPI0030DBDA95
MDRTQSYLLVAGVTIAGIVATVVSAAAASGSVTITKSRGEVCMVSNGLPDHSTGKFPNSGNPHRIKAQHIEVCVPENPVKTSHATQLRGTTGFALNGVLLRPGTADYYDPSSPRGFSRDRSSGWKLDGKGAGSMLGLDRNNAHVDRRGLYHYHASPTGLLERSKSSLVGFAADGFEIHYVGSRARSGYTLKPGTRKSGPGGKHDGTYVQDWQYTGGSGKLDKCNGGSLNGKFVYFITDSYPYLPHCAWGKVSGDFGRP